MGLPRRQSGEGPPHRLALLAADCGFGGVGSRIAHQVLLPNRCLVAPLPPLLRAKGVQGQTRDDATQPRPEVVPAPGAASVWAFNCHRHPIFTLASKNLLVKAQERLLGQILGLRLSTHDAECKAVDGVVMGQEQLFELRLIARPGVARHRDPFVSTAIHKTPPAAIGRPLAAGAAVAAGLGFLGMIAVARMAMRSAGGAGEGGAAGKAARRRDPAVVLLAVLQREGRLIDFLREDIAAYSDAQVGAAARTIHTSCRKVLDEHLLLEPVHPEEEDAKVAIRSGFDAATIRLTGKVSGKPPFRGILRHRGWRTRRVELPTDPEGQDPSIVAPAEIEIV